MRMLLINWCERVGELVLCYVDQHEVFHYKEKPNFNPILSYLFKMIIW